MNCRDEFYIRVCDCGRIHVESRHFRLSLHPAEFVALLRRASAISPLNEDPSGADEAEIVLLHHLSGRRQGRRRRTGHRQGIGGIENPAGPAEHREGDR
jgi:hypothetical protein